jgi:hypothetical protein
MKNLHDLDWFISRIGKRVYRDKNTPPCGCDTCNNIEANGIVITDKDHAQYMYDIQLEFAQEGHYLNYRDTNETEKQN